MKDYQQLIKEIKLVKKNHPEKYKRMFIGLKHLVSREFYPDFELMAEARLEFRSLKMEEKKFLLSVMKGLEKNEDS